MVARGEFIFFVLPTFAHTFHRSLSVDAVFLYYPAANELTFLRESGVSCIDFACARLRISTIVSGGPFFVCRLKIDRERKYTYFGFSRILCVGVPAWTVEYVYFTNSIFYRRKKSLNMCDE